MRFMRKKLSAMVFMVLPAIFLAPPAAAGQYSRDQLRCMMGCYERFSNLSEDTCESGFCRFVPGCTELCWEVVWHDFELCIGACIADNP